MCAKGDTWVNYGTPQYAGTSQWSCADGKQADSGPVLPEMGLRWMRWGVGGQTGGTLAGGHSPDGGR